MMTKFPNLGSVLLLRIKLPEFALTAQVAPSRQIRCAAGANAHALTTQAMKTTPTLVASDKGATAISVFYAHNQLENIVSADPHAVTAYPAVWAIIHRMSRCVTPA